MARLSKKFINTKKRKKMNKKKKLRLKAMKRTYSFKINKKKALFLKRTKLQEIKDIKEPKKIFLIRKNAQNRIRIRFSQKFKRKRIKIMKAIFFKLNNDRKNLKLINARKGIINNDKFRKMRFKLRAYKELFLESRERLEIIRKRKK